MNEETIVEKYEPLFDRDVLDKTIIKWWQWLLLMFLPTYVQCDDGYAFFYKIWRGHIYYVGCETLSPNKSDGGKE